MVSSPLSLSNQMDLWLHQSSFRHLRLLRFSKILRSVEIEIQTRIFVANNNGKHSQVFTHRGILLFVPSTFWWMAFLWFSMCLWPWALFLRDFEYFYKLGSWKCSFLCVQSRFRQSTKYLEINQQKKSNKWIYYLRCWKPSRHLWTSNHSLWCCCRWIASSLLSELVFRWSIDNKYPEIVCQTFEIWDFSYRQIARQHRWLRIVFHDNEFYKRF